MSRTSPPATVPPASGHLSPARVRATRLRSHLLTTPAASLGAAASHMLALQAQDFRAGRWVLAVRADGAPTITDVDRAFDDGEIVRSWTMRGTLHIVAAADLGWILSVTAERQLRQGAARRRELGLSDDDLDRAEREVRTALAGSGRLTRNEFSRVLQGSGIDPTQQRGYYALAVLALRGVVCLGPVVPGEGRPSREQYIVACDDWIGTSSAPADPLVALYAGYARSHAPAEPADFSWWSGLPKGMARAAAEEVAPLDRAPPTGRARSRAFALAPFDEYYLSYADRSTVCAPEWLERVGPSKNGMVKAVIVLDGAVVGVWTHSFAVGRHTEDPAVELFVERSGAEAAVARAIERYRAFATG